MVWRRRQQRDGGDVRPDTRSDDRVDPPTSDPVSSAGLQPPSIWIGEFDSAESWHSSSASTEVWGVLDSIDDQVLRSRHPFTLRGHCTVCDAVTDMAMAWHLGGVDARGSINPAWTLNARCAGCDLVSRMRALIDLLQRDELLSRTTLIAERVTESWTALDRLISDLTGFEYLGPEYRPGDAVDVGGIAVRHDDLEQLSFESESFDLFITQDVFEHVIDLDRALTESARVLRPGGRLVFTVPCFPHLDSTEVLARQRDDGSIEQLVDPPEIHGNPVGEGSLCLRHIGWDILHQLRAAGFESATAHCYWGPWAGHLGGPSFVYTATR